MHMVVNHAGQYKTPRNIYDPLNWNASLFAQSCKDRSRNGIRSVLLGCIKLDNRTSTKYWMVSWVILLRVVGMLSVRIVSTYHECLLYAAEIIFCSSALCEDDTLDERSEEWRASTLLCL